MSSHSIPQKEILHHYQVQIARHATSIQKLKKDKRVLAFFRLTTVLAFSVIVWKYWPLAWVVLPAIFLFIVLFIFLVFRDTDKSAAIQNHERLIRINQHEMDALMHNLQGYEEGQSFQDPAHAYASDLDLFGPASLFQWINRCHGDQSKKRLADFLKTPLSAQDIQTKQQAVKELSGKPDSCQQFQSLAMASPLRFDTEKRIRQWMTTPDGRFENTYWFWIRNIYPLISFGICILYMMDYLSTGTFLFWLIGFFAISSFISGKINPVYEMLSRIQPEMDSVHAQLHLIETENFQSPFLQSVQKKLNPEGYDSAAAAMRAFHGILKKFEFRLNIVVFVVLNGLLLWDLRQVLALHTWKKKNQLHFQHWFDVVAEMEVTISLASLVRNEPDWCFPIVDENYFHFNAVDIGHPLILKENRVTNDFNLTGTGKIVLITGSNMAGKSTFLRSLGINTVLAGMGAPVCAGQMNMSEVKLISSMRVADNLAENTSTFYAELKKLEYIIEAVNRRDPVFILLDEVLRGTNSTDRHKGSAALVRQLLQARSVAVMATHDTELALSESTADESVSNYHFEGKIIADELYFDYKIKKGICESLNATTLMKKIGIHFQD